MNDNEFNQILDLLDKTADNKLLNVRDFVSPLITIVVGILAVVLAINVTPDIKWVFAYIALYLIACIIVILRAYKPRETYDYINPKSNKKQSNENFNILKFETFNVSDDIFNEELKAIKQNDLTEYESDKIYMIKQKINEYYFKKHETKKVYQVIIIGSAILAILFVLAMFV